MSKEVTVLLATYNGARYLKEQLDSLARQVGVAVRLYVSDDGSSDATIRILRGFDGAFASLQILHGPGAGHSENFASLLHQAPKNVPIAFSDQDDIWDEDKLLRAMTVLSKTQDPTLYFSRVRTEVGVFPKLFALPPEAAFFSNCSMGCTQVLSPPFAGVAAETLKLRPKTVPIDWWIWFVAVQFFCAVADETPSMTYRLHSEQTIGIPGNASRYARRLREMVGTRSLLPPTIRALVAVLPELEDLLNLKAAGREVAYADSFAKRRRALRAVPMLGRNNFEGRLSRAAYALSELG